MLPKQDFLFLSASYFPKAGRFASHNLLICISASKILPLILANLKNYYELCRDKVTITVTGAMLSPISTIVARSIGMLCLGIALLSAIACTPRGCEVPDPANAVYYWRQELKLTDGERAFLGRQQVGKVYLHLFDVVRRNGELVPSTTLQFSDTFPSGIQVIPTVFLAVNVMNDTTGLAALPRLIARRVGQMMEQNGLARPHELQIDFDWTRRNQDRYFAFLRQLRQAFAEEGGTTLSATIRLHQLGMEAPPVDYGALMVYNVGRLTDFDETCSILTEAHVEPYLRYLPRYSLPLCAALPAYSWNLLFHDKRFNCILHGVDIGDTARFRPIDASHYLAVSYQAIPPGGVAMHGEGRIFPGDVVRHESVPADVLRGVRRTLARLRPRMCRQVILYHLDENQLKQYSNEELQAIYTGD